MSINADIEKHHQSTSLFKSRWFWLVVIGLVLIAGLGWISFAKAVVGDRTAANNSRSPLEPAPVAGHPAPEFELVNLKGEIVRLSDFKGKPVILNFWATWCGPCRAEFPEFQAAAVDNADDLVIIGINNTSTDNPNEVPKFVEEMGVTFPIVLDEDRTALEAYKVLGLPTTIFIDSNGIVNEVFTGPLNKSYIESKISELSVSL